MKNFNFKIAGRDYTTKVEEQENGTLLVTVNGKTYEVNMPEQAHAIHKTIARPAAAATTPEIKLDARIDNKNFPLVILRSSLFWLVNFERLLYFRSFLLF